MGRQAKITRSRQAQPRKKARRGITLIMVAGVLAILAALGAAFYSTMLMQTKSATRYADSMRADLMMKAGLEDAVSRLREAAYRKAEDPADPWYSVDWIHGAKKRVSFPADLSSNKMDDDGDGKKDNKEEERMPFTRALSSHAGPNSDRYSLLITDAASKININAGDNLGVLLDNLCRIIGPPLVAADPNQLQPARWAREGADAAEYATNAEDLPEKRDIYYKVDKDGLPLLKADGSRRALYGDGYAIAAYRSRNGYFKSLEEVKAALTIVKQPGRPDLEELEREVKFAALRDHITVDSWIDNTTVCVGKFEWLYADSSDMICIDRDKSWVASVDDSGKSIKDPRNERGSLKGCYVSIMNGHGSGQLRRILENGIDWIKVEHGFAVPPGPISSYMIVAKEDALLEDVPGTPNRTQLPRTEPDGRLVDDPNIDYTQRYQGGRPLCIHRAPVNINTATDKVLAAMFLGINVQHGHYMSVGTDADLEATQKRWICRDYEERYKPRYPKMEGTKGIEAYTLTFEGLKRVPISPGKLIWDTTKKLEEFIPAALKASPFDLGYINNYDNVAVNEVHELAARIISARQRIEKDQKVLDPDPFTDDGGAGTGYNRGPFRSWDDFYFRVVKPWDDVRSYFPNESVPRSGTPKRNGLGKASVARMIMAAFNSNTDILKFNPNIEWIDRWGRNFTEMEPVMIYTNDTNNGVNHADIQPANPLNTDSVPIFARARLVKMPMYSWNPVTLADFWYWKEKSNKADDKGDGAFIIRGQRYKSDELIDKTDLNRSTTEFCFDSNGIYDILSTGQVISNGSEMLAERKAQTLVKVYDVWRESTQADFVRGEFSEALNQDLNNPDMKTYSYSGRVTRDGIHTSGSGEAKEIRRLAVNSQPEPLVPLTFRLMRQGGGKNQEVVDPEGLMRDAFGNPRVNPWDAGAPQDEVPDILANRVLPARYDGQLVLASNTARYDATAGGDKDVFLASFVGDLDTPTSAYNGRMQAKVPLTDGGDGYKHRTVDTVGLLGLLNDTLVDVDPQLTNRQVYPFGSVNAALNGLEIGDPGDPNKSYYYNNVQLRMGDLRPDGVFLSNSGVSGRDATMKYLLGNDAALTPNDYRTPKTWNQWNYDPNSTDGVTISMWAKTTWQQNDLRRHEFFNCTNPGFGANARGNFLSKEGRYRFSGDAENGSFSNQGRLRNDFGIGVEARSDHERYAALFGGSAYVPKALMPNPDDPKKPNDPSKHIESPGYYVQPFRWTFLGGRYTTKATDASVSTHNQHGHWRTNAGDPVNTKQITEILRPFMNTSVAAEKEIMTNGTLAWVTTWSQWAAYDTDLGSAGPIKTLAQAAVDGRNSGQDVKWDWADPKGPNARKVFSINNLNYGKVADGDKEMGSWNYRHMPDEGTYSVIDNFKISHKANMAWTTQDRAVQEMMLSRYYLPPDPTSRDQRPWFKSQTLASHLRGQQKADGPEAKEKVTVVRVTWTGFTPRFMHEEREASGTFKRPEYITPNKNANSQAEQIMSFKGPFDTVLYNDEDAVVEEGNDMNGRVRRHASVARPSSDEYKKRNVRPHANSGFEVELLNGETVLGGKTFTDPDVVNAPGTVDKPIEVEAGKLRYRVRFCYPVDNLVDPSGGEVVSPTKHQLLDTPVFDDVSIVYFSKVRTLSFRIFYE